MKERLKNEYFTWLCGFVSDRRYLKKASYQKLFYQLYQTEFTYSVPMDENRAEDGLELRYRFGIPELYLDRSPCSVLEMMTALAIRCEEHIMNNPDIGDQTGQWFFDMLESLGLSAMTDENFDSHYVADVLNRFLKRKYKRNGAGGLFTIHHNKVDMRSVEIWYQAMWHLDEVIKERKTYV